MLGGDHLLGRGLLLTLGPDKPTTSATTEYQRKVAAAFGPLLGANEQVPDTLAALRGTKTAGAKLAVRRAQQSTTEATGALTALTVAAAPSRWRPAAKQVRGRETAYLSTVAAVLSHPSVTAASEAQTLESNLTSANGRDCGDHRFAGPHTSCAFAATVRDAYYEAPGSPAPVRAYSPATGPTYTMDCAPSGSGVTCSGGNDASVTFS